MEQTIDDILEVHSAGSPTDPDVLWTDLKPMQLASEPMRRGFEIARNTAARLLDRAGYRRCSLRKELITGKVDPHQCDHQFHHIDALRRQASAHGNPVLCVDTKKKELRGHLHRPGQCCSTDVQCVYDHDFRHLANALLVPHGIYDYFDNVGFMTLGTSRETSAFVCDAIALTWEEELCLRYGTHYPPYTSKWHPIEHRLFSHVERALRGVILDSHETAREAVQRTRTETGLRVKARILDKVYDIGRKCSDAFRDIKDNFIHHDDTLGQ